MEREMRCFFSSTSSTTTFTTSPTDDRLAGVPDEFVAHLRDVDQTVLMDADIHEHAEVDDVPHRAGEHPCRALVLHVQHIRAQDGAGSSSRGVAPRL